MSAGVESARHQWQDGHRRVEAVARTDARAHWRLLAQIEILTDELRRRIGQTFVLADLSAAYADSERWTQDALAESGVPVRPGEESTAQDAAFHLYARRARDYAP